MRRNLLAAVTALGTVAILFSGAGAQERGEIGIAVGETPAPPTIENLDGEPVDLADHVGERPLLLEFWASWCEQCEALQPSMDAAFERYGDEVGFLAVAVAVAQTQRAVRRHLERHAIPFPMLWDTRGNATRAFLAPATAYVVILDAEGRVAYTGIGPQQDIVQAVGDVLAAEASAGRQAGSVRDSDAELAENGRRKAFVTPPADAAARTRSSPEAPRP